MSRIHIIFVLLISMFLAGCGDDGQNLRDGGALRDGEIGGDAADDRRISGDACEDFRAPAATLSQYPGRYDGQLSGKVADLSVEEGRCEIEDRFYEQPGEDEVVMLEGLSAGAPYLIRLSAADIDVSFYVTTGCVDGTAAIGQCKLFVDQAVANGPTPEAGVVVAPSYGELFVVVDQYRPLSSAESDYTLEVSEAECAASSDCGGTDVCTPLGECVECASAANCEDSLAPICDLTSNTCVASLDECVDDDPSPPEGGDDGPAGAVLLTIEEDSPSLNEGKICSLPLQESDYFSFNLSEAGARSFELAWMDSSQDLDFEIVDAQNNEVVSARSTANPELLVGRFEAETYFIRVFKFAEGGVGSSIATPYSLTGRVPECLQELECLDPRAPICDDSGSCVAGPDACVGDDAGEANNDDGPAGATEVNAPLQSTTSVNAAICNEPDSEVDLFSVMVGQGDNLDVSLSWSNPTPDAPVDLDLEILDSNLNTLGLSFWVNPERIALSHLPSGRVFIKVNKFAATSSTEVTPYVMAVSRSSGGCSEDADCDDVYENQLYRGSCQDSACQSIQGLGTLADGEACDSGDDCISTTCGGLAFASNASRSVCTKECNAQTPCPTGQACLLEVGVCLPSCASDFECGVDATSDTLTPGLPWDYLSCEASTGTCSL